jgi:hypothetical protein
MGLPIFFLFEGGNFMQKRISSIDAFLAGLKPSYFTTTAVNNVKEELDSLKDYPCLDQGVEIAEDETCYLFFQDRQAMDDFSKRIKGFTTKDLEFKKILGLTLGYPPKSVDFFIRKEIEKQLALYSVALSYCGCTALTHVDDITEVANWYWNTYDHKESLQLGMLDRSIGRWRLLESPYQDQEELLDLQSKALEIIHRSHALTS